MNPVQRGQQSFSVTGEIVNILGFVWHIVSVPYFFFRVVAVAVFVYFNNL